LYTGILQDDTGILLMIDGPEGPQGLVAGTTDPAGFYLRLLRRRWFRMGCASLGAVAKNPSIIRRLIGALRKPGEERQNASGALLMSLAVDPRHRRTGLGCELVKAFAVKAAECGSSQIRLTTDKDHNDSVNRFYLRQGFSISRHYVTPEGREMNEYLLDLKGLGLS
jgi:GNAT superfamily N-acetyltransferase